MQELNMEYDNLQRVRQLTTNPTNRGFVAHIPLPSAYFQAIPQKYKERVDSLIEVQEVMERVILDEFGEPTAEDLESTFHLLSNAVAAVGDKVIEIYRSQSNRLGSSKEPTILKSSYHQRLETDLKAAKEKASLLGPKQAPVATPAGTNPAPSAPGNALSSAPFGTLFGGQTNSLASTSGLSSSQPGSTFGVASSTSIFGSATPAASTAAATTTNLFSPAPSATAAPTMPTLSLGSSLSAAAASTTPSTSIFGPAAATSTANPATSAPALPTLSLGATPSTSTTQAPPTLSLGSTQNQSSANLFGLPQTSALSFGGLQSSSTNPFAAGATKGK
eukprot:TRINITY_DN7771_c0_g1_i6.p1 TRINITY_DN7771_c0_g1~~TRINITY_DN7771_c0_g1_i6.p1  ORF type:complete len:333 (+),score=66.00 TRINITY_DN7771_c0_g1_i6:244-1242(+)